MARSSSHIATIIAIVIFGGLSVGAWVFSHRAATHIRQQESTANWTPSTGVIARSEIETVTLRRGARYTPIIEANYTSTEGTACRATYTVHPFAFNTRVEAESVIQQYGIGDQVTIYVNPDVPHWAVIQPGEAGVNRIERQGPFLARIAGVVLGAVALLFIVGYFWSFLSQSTSNPRT